MTDRELLELAAKAAGIKALHSPDGILRDCTGFHPSQNIFAGKPWNPLTDDGDALRLAVKLGIIVDLRYSRRKNSWPITVSYWTKGKQGQHAEEAVEFLREETDPYAATRRAIVRAAAEIGKEMK